MAFIQWDIIQFYRPLFMILLFSRNLLLFSRNPRATPVNTVSRRPHEAAIFIEKNEMTAAYDVTRFNAITSSDQIELFPNQGHIFNSVEAKD
jgi:hypothetical protein